MPIIAFSLDDLNNTVTRLEIADALAGAVAIAVLAGIGLPLVRTSLAPLRRIEATAAAIASGDLSRRIDHPSRGTEVGRLADALDTMLGRIEAAYRARAEGEARALQSEDRMRQFVADASHELRTPLTSVRGLAEFGLQQGSAASPDELLRLMTLIHHEASRMGARRGPADAGQIGPRTAAWTGSHVDLASIAAQAVQAARIVHPDRPIALAADDPVIVYADDRTPAPGHRQPDRQRRAAHPAAVAGHRVRDQYQRNRGDHRGRQRAGDDRRTGRARLRALLPDRRRPDPRPRRHRARPVDRGFAGRRPRRRHHRRHPARPGAAFHVRLPLAASVESAT